MVTTPPTTPLPPPADCQWGRYNVNYVEAEGEMTTLQSVAVGHLRPSAAAATAAAAGADSCQFLSPPPTAEAIRLKRHSSDVTASRTTRATAGVGANNSSGRNSTTKRSNRVARRKSEVSGSCSIAAVAKNQLQHKQQQQHQVAALSLLPPSTTTTTTSCLRHQDNGAGPGTTPTDCHIVVNSRNSDLIVLKTRPSTHKRVAFSDAPAIIWTDRRSPTAASTVVFVNNSSSSSGGGGGGGGGGGHQHHLISPSQQTCSVNKKCSDLAGLEGAAGAADGSTDSSANNSSSSSTVEEVLTPKERRRRKVVMAVVCTTFILLTASALFVLITLFNASAIDEAGRALLFSSQTIRTLSLKNAAQSFFCHSPILPRLIHMSQSSMTSSPSFVLPLSLRDSTLDPPSLLCWQEIIRNRFCNNFVLSVQVRTTVCRP